MDVNAWTLIATSAAVLAYIALPVALAAVYLSRVNGVLHRAKQGDGSTGAAGDDHGRS